MKRSTRQQANPNQLEFSWAKPNSKPALAANDRMGAVFSVGFRVWPILRQQPQRIRQALAKFGQRMFGQPSLRPLPGDAEFRLQFGGSIYQHRLGLGRLGTLWSIYYSVHDSIVYCQYLARAQPTALIRVKK